jgi:hypothetical protein
VTSDSIKAFILAGTLAVVLNGVAAAAATTQGPTAEVDADAKAQPSPEGVAEPVLLKKEILDVDGNGVEDVVAYFDTDSDGVVDGEAIDLSSDDVVDVLALRCDADDDGRNDDWVVVNAKTEEIRAAMIDDNDDGVVESVLYANGRREALPVNGEGTITAAFRF